MTKKSQKKIYNCNAIIHALANKCFKKRTIELNNRVGHLIHEQGRLTGNSSITDYGDDNPLSSWMGCIQSPETEILFDIDFNNFLTTLDAYERDLLIRKILGYSVEEISIMRNTDASSVEDRLNVSARKFQEYFRIG